MRDPKSFGLYYPNSHTDLIDQSHTPAHTPNIPPPHFKDFWVRLLINYLFNFFSVSYDKLLVEDGVSRNLSLSLYAVALVRLDTGANLASLTVESDNGAPTSSTLLIDLGKAPTHAHWDDDNNDGLPDIRGFHNENIYFITKKNRRVQLKQVSQSVFPKYLHVTISV